MKTLYAQREALAVIEELDRLQDESLTLEHASLCLEDELNRTLSSSLEGEYSEERIGRYVQRIIQAAKNVGSRVTRNVKEKLSYLTSGLEPLEVRLADAEHKLREYQHANPQRSTAEVTGGSVLHVNSKMLTSDVGKGLKVTQETYKTIYAAYVTYASDIVTHVNKARAAYQKLDEEADEVTSQKTLDDLAKEATSIFLKLENTLKKVGRTVISGNRQIEIVNRVISPNSFKNKPERDSAQEIRIVKRLDVKNLNRSGNYGDQQEVATGSIKDLTQIVKTLRTMFDWYQELNNQLDKALVDLGTLKEMAESGDRLVFDFKWFDRDPMAVMYRLYFGSGLQTWMNVIEEGLMGILPHYYKILYSGTNYTVSHLKAYDPEVEDT